MIKTIIKRDGSREKFNPAKANGWGEWAAEKLGKIVNWPEVVLHAIRTLPEEVTSQEFQESLIKFCLDKNTWEHNRMAGRLYSALSLKQIYNSDSYPHIMDLHGQMIADGIMVYMNYSKEEYDQINAMLDHDLNLNYAYYSIHQIRYKYAIRNKVTGKEYETPQFVYMRMAMALSEHEPREERMTHVANFYEHFSKRRINPPTPYFVNLGTKLRGYASCCLYETADNIDSLEAGDHIAGIMTASSAGIGSMIVTRTLGDPIRNGLIKHQGKLPYYRGLVGKINENLQNGRGGAATQYYNCFDPEVEVIAKLKNPMTPPAKQVRGLDYAFTANKFFARKFAKNEKVALFSCYEHPALFDAFYSKDESEFERLYNEIEANGGFRRYESARKIGNAALSQAVETGRHYIANISALNSHTPFIEPIKMSNLCTEIALVTKPVNHVMELYTDWQEGYGEIALCSIAGLIPSNIPNDEVYADAAYYSLKMIDFGILNSEYKFKSLKQTATARMNAGVGIIGLAHYMAKHGQKYSTQEGLNFIHELAETHMWHLINASLRLGKEKGNAPWMHKTKWPQGWMPIDTYEKSVDEIVTVGNKRDWEELRARVIENGGIRNSVVCTHMPGESSSIASETTNGLYPIRDYDLVKTNDTMALHYVVPDATKLRDAYEIAWGILTRQMRKCYAVVQKFTDQAISMDDWKDVRGTSTIKSSELAEDFLMMFEYGAKSRYYVNSLTGKDIQVTVSDTEKKDEEWQPDAGDDCGSGGCKL